MSFTDQKPRIATEQELKSDWGYGPGKNFRCKLCGHNFRAGEQWRWVYGGPVHLQNLMVCKECDGTNEEVLNKWVRANEEARNRFWWLF